MNMMLEEEVAALVKFFDAARIKYAILGGVAVLLYGEPRLTMDIDVNISIDRNDIDEFLNRGRAHGFYPIPKNIQVFVRKTGVIPMRYSRGKSIGRCDIIIAENPIEFAALERARIKNIGSVKAKIVSPEDLIIHKITSSRPRDIEDLRGIIRRQRGRIDVKYIKSWLTRIAGVVQNPSLIELFDDLIRKEG